MEIKTIEIKKYKELKGLSQETACFTAELFVNGKKVADVSNDGWGGPNNYHTKTAEDQAIIDQLDVPRCIGLDSKVGELIDSLAVAKILSREKKKGFTCFLKAGDPPVKQSGAFYKILAPADAILARFPGCTIL